MKFLSFIKIYVLIRVETSLPIYIFFIKKENKKNREKLINETILQSAMLEEEKKKANWSY